MPESFRTPAVEFTTAVGQAEAEGQELQPVAVTLDGEELFVAPIAPASALLALARLQGTNGADRAEAIDGYLEIVMLPESLAHVQGRMRSQKRPITIEEVSRFISQLQQKVYGGDRPTVTPSSSPAG